LRREEIAAVAGVSVDYYTRLEQGRARKVSAQVLDALAQALKLDALERDYLHALAHPDGTPAADAPSAKAPAGIRSMVDALDPTPALLHGPFLEVLAVNRMGVRLFADFMAMPVRERNLARWMFLDPRARVVYPQWDVVAPQMVAILRRAAGTRGNSPRLVAEAASAERIKAAGILGRTMGNPTSPSRQHNYVRGSLFSWRNIT
jgi:transcriptional regulator with XRE-family HTH domain